MKTGALNNKEQKEKRLLVKIKGIISKKRLNASYTVEAAFIMPLVFIIVFTAVWFAFLLHDRLVGDAKTAYTAEEARMAVQYSGVPYTRSISIDGYDDEDEREVLYDMLYGNRVEIMSNFMIADVTARDIDISDNALGLGTEITAKLKFRPALMRYVFKDMFEESEHEMKIGSTDFTEISRIVKAAYRFGKQITD